MDQKGAGFYFRAGREVKAIREDCLPGKEESKKTLSSISTNLPRRWKSRPAQRITGACGALRFANKTKKASLTISQSFPAEPRLSSPFEVLPLPSLSITYPGALLSNQKKKKIPIKSKGWCGVVKLHLLFFRPQGSLLDPFPSLPHCSSKCATPYEDLLPFCPLSVHTVLKAEEEGCKKVPRALCPTHLSRSKCSSPVPPNAPISRQRSCECAVMLRMLRHRIDRPSSRSFPVHSLYISDTQGRTRWEGSSPSLCPADHSAGILHSRLRLTAAQGCSCRYVSLSGSLAPPVISFYDMLLSSPYSICHLVISASLRVKHLRKKRRTSFSDSAIAL
ncbi:hypothetical protein LINPERPRIM_LOCUS44255 [Linum perenne]